MLHSGIITVKNQMYKLIWQIKTMLVNQRKHRSCLSPTSLSFPELGTAQPHLLLSLSPFQIGRKPRSSPVTLQEIKNTEAKV